MSRSFRSSYLGKPYQAIRGWYWGKNREAAKKSRYKLLRLFDEDGVPDLSQTASRWKTEVSRLWQKPDREYEIIFRNRRKIMRKRRKLSFSKK